ncbi:phage tail tape measure protein [Streptomyces sp. AK02-04a]|uniref:phage tail tape measure protein n=1 Tax=Streptomyces sp. AK02-04a TaxID=3028649 RepID=UPI0029ABD97D|nr:phage tail tape measure protein [Streptomyces sp. AK02-04a]MDX3754005.1 phage tail tape measure protein [Streptomyces sp. AK02-04a]
MASSAIVYKLIAHDAASRTFNSVGRSASGLDRTLGKLGAAAKMAGAAVAAGLAVGLAEGAKSAAKFQSEMTRISTQAGGTAKDVKVLSDQVLKLGTSTQQGPQHLAESLYHLKSVGMDNVQAMKALKESSDLAAVGHANLEETTNALAGAWRTGIKGATSFHEAVSTVNAIIGAGNMSMDQFNAAIGTGILPSAKTFGLSMKQVGAALALMTDEGIDSASAATRLRMSFSLLGAPSKAAEKQLGKIGLTGLNLADAMRGPKGLIGAIGLLKEHLDKSGLSASKQSQLLSRAFGGGRSSSGILLMLNNLDVLQKKQEQINRSTGKFDDAVKMQRKTAEAQWHLLTSNLEVMGIRVGTKVLPPVTGFIHFLATDAMPAAARFGRAMALLVPVDQIKQGFSQAQGLVSDFLKGFSGTKKATTDLLGGLFDTSPHLGSSKTSVASKAPALAPMPHFGVGQVAPTTGVQGPALAPMPHGGSGLVASLVSPKAKPPKSAAQKIGETIRKAISGGFKDIKWGNLGAILGKGLGNAIGWVGKHTADLTKKFAGILVGINWVDVGKAIGGQAIPFALGFLNNLFAPLFSLDFWKKHWLDVIEGVIMLIPIGRVAGVLGKIFEHIPFLKVFEPLLKGVGKLGGWIEKAFGKVVKFFGTNLWRGLAKVFPEAASVVERESGLLTTRIGLWGIKLMEKGKAAIHFLGNGIRDGAGWVIAKVGEIAGLVVKPFVKASSWLVSKGTAVAKGFGSGVARGGRAIGGFAKKWVIDPIVSGFSRAGSWLLSKGRSLVSGFKSGVSTGAKAIGGWVFDHILAPIARWMARSGSWLISKGRSLVSGFKSGIGVGARAIGSWTISHIVSPVLSRFSKAGSWLFEKGGSLVSGLKSGVVDKLKGIGTWVKKSFVDPIVGWVRRHFGINSPSKVFMGIGKSLTKGLVMGMAKTHPKAIVEKVFGSLPNALGAMVSKGLISVKNLPGKALKALGGLGGKFASMLGLGGDSSASGAAQKYAQLAMKSYGWGPADWPALKALWNGESGWNPNAVNKSSGAYGIPQALGHGHPYNLGDYAAQINWGLNYIKGRYGSPSAAWSFWQNQSPHWYAEGTGGAAKGLAWVGEKGPELVNFKGGEDVLSNPQSMAFAKANNIKLPGYASGTITNAADRVRRDHQRVQDAKGDVARAKRRHKGVQAAETRLRAAQKELAAANIALKNAQRSAKTSIANTIATGLLKTLSTGTSSSIASAIKSLATKLLNAGYNKTAASMQKKGGQLEKLADRRASVQKTIAAANQYASDQASNITDFLSISGTSATDIGSLISQMSGQQKTASDFVGLSKSLKARGASKALLQQLSDAGPGSQLATILGQRNVTTQDISKLNSLVASGGKLATSFGRDMADLMYDTGKHAGEGFLAGLKATEKDLQKQIDKLAKSLVDSIKKALKIKSPSVVMRDEVGKQVVLGMVHGMDLHGHLVGGAAQRLADTATGVSLRRRYVPAVPRSGAGQEEIWERLAVALEQQGGQPQHLTGQLVLDSGELLGVIKGTVKPMVSESEKRQAYRAKVGRRTS